MAARLSIGLVFKDTRHLRLHHWLSFGLSLRNVTCRYMSSSESECGVQAVAQLLLEHGSDPRTKELALNKRSPSSIRLCMCPYQGSTVLHSRMLFLCERGKCVLPLCHEFSRCSEDRHGELPYDMASNDETRAALEALGPEPRSL